LSEKTGGTAEFISSGEDTETAAQRIAHRLHSVCIEKTSVDWGVDAVWESPLPQAFYDKETLNLFAFSKEKPQRPAVLRWEAQGESYEEKCPSLADSRLDFLHRLGGAARFKATAQEEPQSEIALRYQLVTSSTNLILVHERLVDKADKMPILQQVPQMMAHGWGGDTGLLPFRSKSGRSLRDIELKSIYCLKHHNANFHRNNSIIELRAAEEDCYEEKVLKFSDVIGPNKSYSDSTINFLNELYTNIYDIEHIKSQFNFLASKIINKADINNFKDISNSNETKKYLDSNILQFLKLIKKHYKKIADNKLLAIILNFIFTNNMRCKQKINLIISKELQKVDKDLIDNINNALKDVFKK
jgi:hypothetical protein